MNDLLEIYNNIKECVYKNERYSVRDNGAVLRYSIDGKKIRPLDNKWNFGKLNCKNGYLEIASVRIHRIVATAFHGEAPTKEHVVDHIDTNKQNNRPENLRWVTRLENILLNPITIRRIEHICGSVEDFLANPADFRDKFQNQDFKWMTSVTVEEAQISKERLLAWAESDKPLNGGSLGDWIYYRNFSYKYSNNKEKKIDYIKSLTVNAVQNENSWKTPTEFICCPKNSEINSLKEYLFNLKIGSVFARNNHTNSLIENFAISTNEDILWVMCKNEDEEAMKPYSLAEITFHDNMFKHHSLGTFFEKRGAEKQFTLVQGLEWSGEEGIDDYC